MIEVESARDAVLERVSLLASEDVPLRSALGRVLGEEVRSVESVPGFDSSAMDGFAVRADDTRGAVPDAAVALRIVGESRAGRPTEVTVGVREAIRIST